MAYKLDQSCRWADTNCKTQYVMFGHNSLLGEMVDIIHLRGGWLSKIVQNIPERKISNRQTLAAHILTLPPPDFGDAVVSDALYPVEIESLKEFSPRDGELYVMGFIGPKQRHLINDIQYRLGIRFESLVHPSAIISPSVEIGEGVLIMPGVIIGSNVNIGQHSFINKAAIIGHDSRLADYVIVQPGVKISGYVDIGEGAHLGAGSIIIEERKVGYRSIVAAGAVVIDDVSKNTMVAGVPATIKKRITDHD